MIIGVTGRIACGKSTVTKYLEDRRYKVIDADHIARSVLKVGQIGYRQVVKYFGNTILNEDMTINRQELGDIVFTHRNALNVLNAITHPLIEQRIRHDIISHQANNFKVVLDMPLLLNNEEMIQKCDKIINVELDEEIQLERLMNRNKHLTERECHDRIRASRRPWTFENEEELDAKVISITNNGTVEELLALLKSMKL